MGAYFLEKYDGLSKSVAFAQNWAVLTDQYGPKGGPLENEFWLFSNTKTNTTYSYSGKSGWKK